MLLAQELEAAATVCAAHPQLERHEVRAAGVDERQDLRPGVGRPDELEVLDRLERPPDTLQHQSVVIRNQYAHSATLRRFRSWLRPSLSAGLTYTFGSRPPDLETLRERRSGKPACRPVRPATGGRYR